MAGIRKSALEHDRSRALGKECRTCNISATVSKNIAAFTFDRNSAVFVPKQVSNTLFQLLLLMDSVSLPGYADCPSPNWML